MPWHLFLMAVAYIAAGLNHFRSPKIYLKMMPPLFPRPRLLVVLSGLAEVLLGLLLLFDQTRELAAWGVVALLIAVFPANLYMLKRRDLFPKIPLWALILRLPLQGILIWWACRYT